MRPALILSACLLLFPAAARADGVMWEAPQAKDLVAEKAQQAWIEWKDGQERLMVAVAPQDVSKRLAWMLPVPAPAKDVRLELARGLPDWGGREVRAAAQLALHPVLIIFYFLLLSLTAGGCGSGAATLVILFVLSAISIGPGPSLPTLADLEVRTSGRVELAGLASEIAEAPSVEAFESYLKAKSCELPLPARSLVEEHIRQGHAFIVSWATAPAVEAALAVDVRFPAAKLWYPTRLSSAYGQAKMAVDLRLAGWQAPDSDLPVLLGYYGGGGVPARFTRVVFQGRAERLSQDWTFVPAPRTWHLHIAALAAQSDLLFNVLLLLLCSMLCGMLAGWLAYPDWRGLAGLGPLSALGASGVLPVLGPVSVLGWLRAAPAAKEPAPAPAPPKPPRAWPVQGVALVLLGAVGQTLGLGNMDGLLGVIGYLAGALACVAGLCIVHVRRGASQGEAILAGLVISVFLPVVGPLLGLFMDSEAKVGDPVKAAPVCAVDRRAKVVAFAAAAGALFLHITAGLWLEKQWSLEHATASLHYSGSKFADLIRKSNEGATRGNLGAMRSALSIYYGDTGGRYPATLEALTAGRKYLPDIPVAKTGAYHADSSAVLRMTNEQFAAGEFTDAGGWAYVVEGPSSGTVVVNCTHMTTKDSVWTTY